MTPNSGAQPWAWSLGPHVTYWLLPAPWVQMSLSSFPQPRDRGVRLGVWMARYLISQPPVCVIPGWWEGGLVCQYPRLSVSGASRTPPGLNLKLLLTSPHLIQPVVQLLRPLSGKPLQRSLASKRSLASG